MVKNLVSLCYILLITLIVGCSSQTVEEIVETHADGTPKVIVLYFVGEETKTKMATTQYYVDGTVELSGQFNTDQKRIGKWLYNYPSGILWSESVYESGKREGYSCVYYKNGKKRYEGNYKADKTIGTWQFYDEGGKLVKTQQY
jgi:antitoxin component YwqK of YwqJK toxin-antitoxin module